jgi:hypothetical protein
MLVCGWYFVPPTNERKELLEMPITLICKYCPFIATWIFNDNMLACDDCREARLGDPHRIETENDLSWQLSTFRQTPVMSKAA